MTAAVDTKRCLYCNQEFYRRPSDKKYNWKRKKYCSKRCMKFALREKMEEKRGTSLCLSCRNARADRCDWVANFEPVWKRAEEKEIVYQSGGVNKKSCMVTVKVVRDCDHYVPNQGRRKCE